MNLWRSTLPDGRPGKGLGHFLLAFGILLVVALYWKYTSKKEIVAKTPDLGANIERLSNAVASDRHVEDPKSAANIASERDLNTVQESSEVKQNNPAPEQKSQSSSAIDIVGQMAITPEDERPRIPEAYSLPGMPTRPSGANVSSDMQTTEDGDYSSSYRNRDGASEPRMFATGSSQNQDTKGGPIAVSLADLKIFRATAKAPASAPNAGEHQPKWIDGQFLPRGYDLMEVYLLDMVRTDQQQPIVTFAVAKDVKYHGKVVIPFGTMVLANVAGAPAQGQNVIATPMSLQFPDGSEVALSGVIKSLDGSMGMPAIYVPLPMEVQFNSLVAEFISSYLNLLYVKQSQLKNLTIGGVSVTNTTSTTFDPAQQALASASDAINEFAKNQLTELQNRFAAHLVVPPGAHCKIQLLAPLDLSTKAIGSASVMHDKAYESLKEAAKQAISAAKNGASNMQSELSTALSKLGTTANSSAEKTNSSP